MNARILATAFALGISVLAAPVHALRLGVTSVDFGAQSVNTTSPARTITLTNTGALPVTVATVTAPADFGVGHNCTLVAAGASCAATATFTPRNAGNSSGNLTIVSTDGTQTVELAGSGEKSLTIHYYRAILRRAADSPGKAFWESEAMRVTGLGADTNETWYAMALQFFGSAEYTAFNRDDEGFLVDLYTTFFNRSPDASGLAYWSAQMSAGLPREVVLASFMFSPEFTGFTQGIFGKASTRPEIDVVVDFYRGLLSRLPDSEGFGFWLEQFRKAQCTDGAAVNAQVESISSAYATSAEYAARRRSDSQYVGDLYNAFLRRGGDLTGVKFWIDEIASGRRTREQVRRAFISQPEFQARVAAVLAAGCNIKPAGRFSFTSATGVGAPDGNATVTIQRTEGTGGAYNVFYSYQGSGCARSETAGPVRFADGDAGPKTATVPLSGSGVCDVLLVPPPAPALLAVPIGTSVTVVPVVPGCPTPSDVTPASLKGNGQPLLQRQRSGQTAFIPVPSLSAGRISGQVSFGESAGGAYTPQPVTLEVSISKCPGIIDTDYGNYCNMRSTNSNYNSITYLLKGNASINAQVAASLGYCWAGESGPYYINARWSYSRCAFGVETCGFAIQYNDGPY